MPKLLEFTASNFILT